MNAKEPSIRIQNGAAIPAVILCEAGTVNLRLAGLTLADRLVVAVHRAGCSPIQIVVPEGCPDPSIERARRWDVPIEFVREVPETRGTTLFATTSVLVTVDAVRRVLGEGGRLTDDSGTPLPLALVPELKTAERPILEFLPSVPAGEGVARNVTDKPSARAAAEALWATITSSTDGLVDRHFNRPVGRVFSKLLVWTPITPNQVSVASILIGILAGYLFGWGDPTLAIVASVLFQLSAVVDCMDGDIARVGFKESPLGKWLDIVGDQVVHVSVFAGIAWGLMKHDSGTLAGWLGVSAVGGALLSFAVVLRGFRLPPSEEKTRMQKFIDGATTRDFSVLLLMLAVVGRLEWFLWLTAIGSHCFWVTLLAVQLRAVPSRATTA